MDRLGFRSQFRVFFVRLPKFAAKTTDHQLYRLNEIHMASHGTCSFSDEFRNAFTKKGLKRMIQSKLGGIIRRIGFSKTRLNG